MKAAAVITPSATVQLDAPTIVRMTTEIARIVEEISILMDVHEIFETPPTTDEAQETARRQIGLCIAGIVTPPAANSSQGSLVENLSAVIRWVREDRLRLLSGLKDEYKIAVRPDDTMLRILFAVGDNLVNLRQ
jgi:hypothetical protein